MLHKTISFTVALFLLSVAFLAQPTLAETKAANTMAVCGCGKVFVPDAKTEFLSYGGKQYACCSHECHLSAGKNPAEAAKMWQAAYTKVMSGGKKTREDVYAEIQAMMGVVPSMFKSLPDESLSLEWDLFKQVQFMPGAIPNKYRELIGVAVAAAMKCQYCSYYHTQVAKLNGATDAEIEDATHYAKSSAGWSTYINGLQIDYGQFKREVDQACSYVKSTQANTEK
jgi:AhpD family alkylhydroperoxidase